MPTGSSESIIVECQCGKRFRAKSEHARKRAKCPGCGAVLEIPSSEPPTAPPPKPGASSGKLAATPAKQRESVDSGPTSQPPDPQQEVLTIHFEGSASGTCFFCESQPGTDDSVCYVPMHKIENVKGAAWDRLLKSGLFGGLGGFLPGKTVFYRMLALRLPCCKGCKAWHYRLDEHKGKWTRPFEIAGTVVAGSGVTLVLATQKCMYLGIGIGLGLLLWIIGVIINSRTKPRLPSNIGPYEHYESSPAFKKLTAEGWSFGEQPDVEPHVKRQLIPDYAEFEETVKAGS